MPELLHPDERDRLIILAFDIILLNRVEVICAASRYRCSADIYYFTGLPGFRTCFVYFYFPNFNLLTKHYNDGQMASKIEAFVLVWCLTDGRA